MHAGQHQGLKHLQVVAVCSMWQDARCRKPQTTKAPCTPGAMPSPHVLVSESCGYMRPRWQVDVLTPAKLTPANAEHIAPAVVHAAVYMLPLSSLHASACLQTSINIPPHSAPPHSASLGTCVNIPPHSSPQCAPRASLSCRGCGSMMAGRPSVDATRGRASAFCRPMKKAELVAQ